MGAVPLPHTASVVCNFLRSDRVEGLYRRHEAEIDRTILRHYRMRTDVCLVCNCESALGSETATDDRRVEVNDCVLCDHVVQHVASDIE